jgi:ribosomal protein S12 methylthiotransferase accessory factor
MNKSTLFKKEEKTRKRPTSLPAHIDRDAREQIMSERELSTLDAKNRILSIISKLGLRVSTRYTHSGKLVATADLFDNRNVLVASGAGKGPDCLVGALAESIEHYATLHSPSHSMIFQSCQAIASQKETESDGLFTSLPLTTEPIKCFELKTLCKAKHIFIPSIILCPQKKLVQNTYNNPSIRHLARYSSNSGVAFGCTQAEALLHGINEAIERHILSTLFMAVCGLRANIDLYSPSEYLLKAALRSNAHALEIAKELQILITKDFFGVYFSIAFPKVAPQDFFLSPLGSGCSMDVCIAIERAVTEQLQTSTLYGETEKDQDSKTYEFLSTSKILNSLIHLDPIRSINFPTLDSSKDIINLSVSEQISDIHRNLRNNGKDIYQRTIVNYADHGSVEQVYIPGLERFNIIRNGSPVVPQYVLRSDEANIATLIL